MLYLVFGHTAEEAPLRTGPMSSFRLVGPDILDQAGTLLARHNGHRWMVQGRSFYRIDCEGPVSIYPDSEAAAPRGPYEHFSLFNGTAYASRDVFAHYNEHDGKWHLYATGERFLGLRVAR